MYNIAKPHAPLPKVGNKQVAILKGQLLRQGPHGTWQFFYSAWVKEHEAYQFKGVQMKRHIF